MLFSASLFEPSVKEGRSTREGASSLVYYKFQNKFFSNCPYIYKGNLSHTLILVTLRSVMFSGSRFLMTQSRNQMTPPWSGGQLARKLIMFATTSSRSFIILLSGILQFRSGTPDNRLWGHGAPKIIFIHRPKLCRLLDTVRETFICVEIEIKPSLKKSLYS